MPHLQTHTVEGKIDILELHVPIPYLYIIITRILIPKEAYYVGCSNTVSQESICMA